MARASVARDELQLGGAVPSGDPPFGLLLFKAESAQVAEDFAQADPYTKGGVVTSWRVREWITVVGEDAHFSGGEAQRISIARALLADTPILVLDEATAFADPDSEAQIQAALSTLIEGRTVLVIAHRLGSIVGADNIVVLGDGRIVEQGRHGELLSREGVFARMWQTYTAAGELEAAR